MLPGIQTLESKEPARTLPETVDGLRIALKMFGGVGDALISIGSVAPVLSGLGAVVTAVVSERHLAFMSEVDGVTHVDRSQAFNDPAVRHKQDVLIDFSRTFNSHRELRGENYYKLVGDKVGFPVRPGRFKNFQYEPFETLKQVCIHPSASNPNRKWVDAKWRLLAYELRECGYHVMFLGMKDEFGFRDDKIAQYSDVTTDLISQIICVSTATHFIGCDSGFAHIAGMLGCPGTILFGNTEAEHVIAEYPSLQGVDAYDRVGYRPTRSLKVGCQKSMGAMAAIQVEDVLRKVLSNPRNNHG